MPDRPDIIILYTDQQRHDTIHALGNDVIATPNMDRLVREGVAFTHGFTPCPVCMPARWSLHSGQYTSTHQCYSNHHPGERPAQDLPGLLRTAGYRTGLVGKNHSFLTPDDLNCFVQHPESLNATAREEREAWVRDKANASFPRLADEPAPGGVEGDHDRARTDAALQFLRDRDDRPTFLWLSYHHPHTPYWTPEPYFSMYDDAPVPDPVVEENGLASKPFRHQFHQRNNDAIMPFTDAQIMRMRRTYDGMISLVDAEIGRILEYLDETGRGDNTLIVFTSDHGDYMGDHGLVTKSPSLYDCLVRVPFVVKWPGHADENRRDNRFVSAVDILPTCCAAAGIDCPDAAEGGNLLPLLSDGGNGAPLRSSAYAEYGVPGDPYDQARLEAEALKPGDFPNPFGQPIPWEGNPVSLAGRIRMVRTHDWKLVEEPGGTNELYHLKSDPHELVNRYGNADVADIQAELHAELATWQGTVG